jgi:hypothetical protein
MDQVLEKVKEKIKNYYILIENHKDAHCLLESINNHRILPMIQQLILVCSVH